jgi:hypothetical protein
LKAKCDEAFSNSAANFNMRRYTKARGADLGVTLPPGNRGNLLTDFVLFERRMSTADAEAGTFQLNVSTIYGYKRPLFGSA